MTWQRRAVRLAGPPVLTCPDCLGSQEVGTHQDSFGAWETRPCPTCRAEGFLPVAEVVDLLAERAAEETARTAPVTSSLEDPWTAGWPAGWEGVEPPF